MVTEVEQKGVWYRKIPKFSGYIASSDGKIFSVQSIALTEVKGRDNGFGYFQVVLYRCGKPCEKYVHNLIAETFLGPPPKDGQVYQPNHRNKNRKDNSIDNLEWTSVKDNIWHRDGKEYKAC